ncbi:MAG TPA: 1-acyl-sn-glycerol-3-phosphate acyltransferase [Anaeromyxobacteraceae bacterium]|nr:1-acyl-sn-glycerol-3-phosphate acyltransferase [Anaeromyxobacteraceae bacterium]
MPPPSPAAPRDSASGPRRTGFLDRWFSSVRVPPDAASELASAARQGSVVFVMRSAGLLNFLFVAWMSRRFSLPPLRAALGLTGVMPWLARVDGSTKGLEAALARGESAMVFLSGASGPDPFPLLVSLQRRSARPILLVPALLVWSRRPQKLKWSVGGLLFGTPEAPSRLANAIAFLVNRERAVLRLGRPADAAAFLRERAGELDAALGRKMRGALHHHLAREMRTVVGPPLKSVARVRAMVLRDKSLRHALREISAETGKPFDELLREAERDVAEIESRYSPTFIEVAARFLSWFFGRTFDAVELDEEGLQRVKRAAGSAPLVLCPSHKSHVDYLVLSWVFYEAGLRPPVVAAGINLSFWPFGSIARAGGAFFIRRTVKGDRVYTAALRAYVKQLLRDRSPQEFYLEGGRSRTGKLLFPKTGLFSMEVDAWLEGAAQDVLFVPVAIDYEALIESRAYARELSGGEKKKEDIRGLLRARKVLWRRYGRLYVQFGEPVSLRAIAEARLGPDATSLVPAEVMESPAATAGARDEGERRGGDKRRMLVQALANRVAWGIARATTITPVGLVAAALLSHVRRGLTATELERRVEFLRRVAAERGSRFARGLATAPADPRLPGPIADALAKLVSDGLVRVELAAGEPVYQTVDERRTQLDFHRNGVLQRFVGPSLVCAALRSLGGDAALGDLRERARFASRLLKLEFMYRPGANLDELLVEYVAVLERAGTISREGDRLRIGPDTDSAGMLADLTRALLESYRIAVDTLQQLSRDPDATIDRKQLVKAMLERGRAAFATGRVAQRESISRATFENATEWFVQEGALVRSGERLRIDATWREVQAASTLRVIDQLLTQINQ